MIPSENKKKTAFKLSEPREGNFNSIQVGGRWETTSTGVSQAASTTEGIRPQNFLTFSFNLFNTLM